MKPLTLFQNGVIPYGYKTADLVETVLQAFQNGVIPYGYKTNGLRSMRGQGFRTV